MQGYMTILSEAWIQGNFNDSTGSNLPTHVFLQVGVGSFSGGMVGFLVNKMKSWKTHNATMKIVVVEPRGADCIFRSHQRGDGKMFGTI